MAITITLLIVLAVIAGAIILQIHLSKKENKWPGLIMPIIFFGISMLYVLGFLFFYPVTVETTVMENGVIIEQSGETLISPTHIVIPTIITFLIFNIPTIVLILIYVACRGKRNKQRALEKMSVQDLE